MAGTPLATCSRTTRLCIDRASSLTGKVTLTIKVKITQAYSGSVFARARVEPQGLTDIYFYDNAAGPVNILVYPMYLPAGYEPCTSCRPVALANCRHRLCQLESIPVCFPHIR